MTPKNNETFTCDWNWKKGTREASKMKFEKWYILDPDAQ